MAKKSFRQGWIGYESDIGVWHFEDDADDLCWLYMWTLLTDLSKEGKREVIERVKKGEPPKEYFEIRDRYDKEAQPIKGTE